MNLKDILGWNFGKRIKRLEGSLEELNRAKVQTQTAFDVLNSSNKRLWEAVEALDKRIASLEKENLTNTTYDVGIQSRIHELEKRLAKLETPKKLPVKRKVKK